jgi:hypothetical protein
MDSRGGSKSLSTRFNVLDCVHDASSGTHDAATGVAVPSVPARVLAGLPWTSGAGCAERAGEEACVVSRPVELILVRTQMLDGLRGTRVADVSLQSLHLPPLEDKNSPVCSVLCFVFCVCVCDALQGGG